MLSDRLKQLRVFAKILAQVVLPTPRGPQKRYAWATCPDLIALFSVFEIAGCPTTVSKLTGLYFRADTKKLLMQGGFSAKIVKSGE
jgi:hypothetical protein